MKKMYIKITFLSHCNSIQNEATEIKIGITKKKKNSVAAEKVSDAIFVCAVLCCAVFCYAMFCSV